MKIMTIELKNVYGKPMAFPVCETAKLFSKLTGRKTFSLSDIKTIKQLGYTVAVKRPKLSEIGG